MSAHRTASSRNLLRQLPSVERLIAKKEFRTLAAEFGRDELVAATRAGLDDLRRSIENGQIADGNKLVLVLDSLERSIRDRLLSQAASTLRPLINATGIIIHTNLGRAPLSRPAVEALSRVASGYCSLELDLESGKRGRREQHAARPLARLFPGCGSMIVNNNAAAVLLVLNSFALSREVIISRGELVEIGGSFRIPEILERSGAKLREVGTTNKTRISDYQEALGPATGAILRVHPSNFRMVGFTENATTDQLVKLGRQHLLPVIEDFGSGNLLPLGTHGLPNEPTVQDSLAEGVDLVTFSGDKLLGGPQAGVIVGSPERVEVCGRNPLARALRIDKLTYSAMEATLAAYLKGRAWEEIPVLKMLSTPAGEIDSRARQLVARAGKVAGLKLAVAKGFSKVGGGAAPEEELPTSLISVSSDRLSEQQLLDGLRAHEPPVVARISENQVLLDLRTVLPEQESILLAALESLDPSRK